MYIVDGQHRLEACRELKIPVYYIIDEKAQEDDLIHLNTVRSNWTLPDYVYFHYQKKAPNTDYIFIQDLINKYSRMGIKFSYLFTPIELYCMISKRTSFTKELKQGDLRLKNKDLLFDFLDATLHRIKELNILKSKTGRLQPTTLFFHRSYLRCFCHLFKHMNKTQYQHLFNCMERDILYFAGTNSVEFALKAMADSFNKGLKKNAQETLFFDFSKIKKMFEPE